MDGAILYLIVALAFAALLAAFIVKDIVVRRMHGGRYRWRESIASYGMLAPSLILAVLFVLLPIVFSLGYAFTDYRLGSAAVGVVKFNGLRNFKLIFKNLAAKGNVLTALENTGLFVVMVVPLQIILALCLALIVNHKMRGMGIFKVLFFAPQVISLTVTSFLWLRILENSDVGLLNAFLGKLHMGRKDFLGSRYSAMAWIVIISAWQGAGYQMLIFLSGLQNVRKELYEAASLDGAGRWRQFWSVTLPGLQSTSVFIIITVFIGACKVMVQPMLMTPNNNSMVTMNLLMYNQGYRAGMVGYSSALALVMTVVIGAVTLVQRYALREKD